MAAVVDLVAIHQAVCDTINVALPDARCYSSYRDAIEPACIIVTGARNPYIQNDMAMRQGTVKVNLIITLLGPSGDRAGQEQIMRWMSMGAGQTESIVNALSPVGADGSIDRTLGGVVGGFVWGATKFAAAIEYPQGSTRRFAVGEIDLTVHV